MSPVPTRPLNPTSHLHHPHLLHLPPPAPARINNAGTNAYRYGPMAESTDEELSQIVGTNVLGVMLCCKEVGWGGEG